MSETDSEPPAPRSPDPAATQGMDLAEWRRRWADWQPQPPLPAAEEAAPAGPWGKLKRAFKRLLRRATFSAQRDLWQRQSRYNLELIDEAERQRHAETRLGELLGRLESRVGGLEASLEQLGGDLQTVQKEITRDIRGNRDQQVSQLENVQEALLADLRTLRDDHLEYLNSHASRLDNLEGLENEGFEDLRQHQDALFGRVDQKLDDYRRRSRRLWAELEGLLAVVEQQGPEAVVATDREQDYLALEEIFRGREEEIQRRIDPYLVYLEGRGEVLDLGCGRGEALEVLAGAGIPCRGIDSNSEMVAICRGKGLEAESGDLFQTLAGLEPGRLGGIVSFHVIEHLPADSLTRLVRLAWRALGEGGVLALETPSPLSLVVAARNFWIDPTHLRPVHPDTLRHTFRRAGFDPVRRIDLQPFADESRLPEISAAGLGPEPARLVEQVNALRDALDALLFGYQDYGMIGFKPAAAGEPRRREDRADG